jgi:hypothetical protein
MRDVSIQPIQSSTLYSSSSGSKPCHVTRLNSTLPSLKRESIRDIGAITSGDEVRKVPEEAPPETTRESQ